MTTIENNTNEEKRSLSFVEQLVEEDLARVRTEDVFRHVSRQSQMAIFILVMRKRFAWTLV